MSLVGISISGSESDILGPVPSFFAEKITSLNGMSLTDRRARYSRKSVERLAILNKPTWQRCDWGRLRPSAFSSASNSCSYAYTHVEREACQTQVY